MIKALLRQNDRLARGRIWLGSVVKNVQRGLVQAGHPMTADGKFGPKTMAAVKDFQDAHRLKPDGKIGFKTLTEMAKYLPKEVPAI